MNTNPRCTLFCLAALLLCRTALAEDPLACVDSDIAQSLLLGPSAGSPVITREWSPRVPRFSVPAQFTLIGSRTAPYTAIVALQTPMSVPDTSKLLESAMTAAGWQKVEAPSGPPPDIRGSGFQVARPAPRGQPGQAAGYCHERQGWLATGVTAAAPDVTYVTLMTSGLPDITECERRQARFDGRGAALDAPELLLPEGTIFLSGGSSGGHRQGTDTYARVRSTLSPAELLDSLADELASQRWRSNSQWSGATISGSTWLSQDERQAGLLTIVRRADDQYDLEFQTFALR